MKHRKVLGWFSLLLVGAALAFTAIMPAHHVYAQSSSSSTISTSGATPDTTCEQDGDPLDWLLCPVFNAVSDTASYLFQNVIVPFLKVPPVSTNPNDASFNVWSTFRVYGDIVLIIVILIVIFGEVIGGGVVDAYTARKMLPRILLAVILINLSVYIVAGLVDITNIIGNGIGNIIIAPFKYNHQLNFNLSSSQGFGVLGIGFIGFFAAGGSLAVLALALFTNFGTVAFAAFLAVLPFIFAIIAVFATLIFRQGIILFLVMVSPIAFALYCLPNTERVFRRWWDFLIEALMVYPIVIIIFAVADVLAGTILAANNITLTSGSGPPAVPSFLGHTLAAVTAFILQFAPLFLIPFAFRMASGTLGRIHEAITKGAGAVGTMAQKRAEAHKEKFSDARVQSQQRALDSLKSRRDAAARNNHGIRRWAYDSFGVNRVAGSNPDAADSARQRAMKERTQELINNGKDGVVRGIGINKDKALQTAEGDEWQIGTDEQGREVRQFKSLGGAWINESDVDKANAEFKGNKYAYQEMLAYEQRKATRPEEIDHLVNNYDQNAREDFGLTQSQAAGAWIGAGFTNQNENLQYKYMRYGEHGLETNGLGLLREIDEKKGVGEMARQSADTWATMNQAVVNARAVRAANQAAVDDRRRAQAILDDRASTADQQRDARQRIINTSAAAKEYSDAGEALTRASRIASTLTMPSGQRLDEEGNPMAGGAGIVGATHDAQGRPIATGAWAPGHVQEEMSNFLLTVQGRGPRQPNAPIDNRPNILDSRSPERVRNDREPR